MQNTFNEGGVMITRNALSAGGQVFALRDIQDVRVVVIRKNKAFPAAISIVGAAVAAVGALGAPHRSGAELALGVMLVVVGALAWLWQDVRHQLLVKTPQGEREAVLSSDLDFLARVEQAVRAALANSTSA